MLNVEKKLGYRTRNTAIRHIPVDPIARDRNVIEEKITRVCV